MAVGPSRYTADMAQRIVSDPTILGGKPTVSGTRLSVALLLELIASGATRDELLESYPQLTPDGLTAALAYAAAVVDTSTAWERQIPA